MIRKLAALLSAFILASLVLAFVAGPAAAIVCTGAKVTLYEDADGRGDSVTFCNTQVSNLANVPHTQAGGCAKAFGESSTWNDCVSSFRLEDMAATKCFRIYAAASYGDVIAGGTYSGWSNVLVNMNVWDNDTASSFKFYTC